MQRLHINQQNPSAKPQQRRTSSAKRPERDDGRDRRQCKTHQRSDAAQNMTGHEKPTYIAAGGAEGLRFSISSRAVGIMS